MASRTTIRWLGHFQPRAEHGFHHQAIATARKVTSELWWFPRGRTHSASSRAVGLCSRRRRPGRCRPLIRIGHGCLRGLRQKAVKGPASFAVLLYPAADNGAAPLLEALPSDTRRRLGFGCGAGPTTICWLSLLLQSSPIRIGKRWIGDGCGDGLRAPHASRWRRPAWSRGAALNSPAKLLIEVGPEVVSASSPRAATRSRSHAGPRGDSHREGPRRDN